MLQFAVWTALSNEGLGASLQVSYELWLVCTHTYKCEHRGNFPQGIGIYVHVASSFHCVALGIFVIQTQQYIC